PRPCAPPARAYTARDGTAVVKIFIVSGGEAHARARGADGRPDPGTPHVPGLHGDQDRHGSTRDGGLLAANPYRAASPAQSRCPTTSSPPSRVMNPHPFSSSNHFTRP